MKSGVLSNTIFHSDLPYVTLLDYAEASVFNATYDEGYNMGGARVYTRTETAAGVQAITSADISVRPAGQPLPGQSA